MRNQVVSRMMHIVPLTPDIAGRQAEWQGLTDEGRARIIVAAMSARKISQAELARQLGITSTAVNAWVNGRSTADWGRWMAICMALDLPLLWRPGDQISPSGSEVVRKRAH